MEIKLVEQISGRVEFNSDRITLDDVEGVDPDEWVLSPLLEIIL